MVNGPHKDQVLHGLFKREEVDDREALVIALSDFNGPQPPAFNATVYEQGGSILKFFKGVLPLPVEGATTTTTHAVLPEPPMPILTRFAFGVVVQEAGNNKHAYVGEINLETGDFESVGRIPYSEAARATAGLSVYDRANHWYWFAVNGNQATVYGMDIQNGKALPNIEFAAGNVILDIALLEKESQLLVLYVDQRKKYHIAHANNQGHIFDGEGFFFFFFFFLWHFAPFFSSPIFSFVRYSHNLRSTLTHTHTHTSGSAGLVCQHGTSQVDSSRWFRFVVCDGT